MGNRSSKKATDKYSETYTEIARLMISSDFRKFRFAFELEEKISDYSSDPTKYMHDGLGQPMPQYRSLRRNHRE